MRRSKRKKWKWIHAAALIAAAQGLSFALTAFTRGVRDELKGREQGSRGDDVREFYGRQDKPAFAPPPWLFGPAWITNNVLSAAGLIHVLNLPRRTRGRARYIRLQIASWIDFTIYSAASFGLRSNLHGAVLTNLYLLLTIESLREAGRMRDPKAALALSTLTPWLGLASALSVSLLVRNGDELYGIEPSRS